MLRLGANLEKKILRIASFYGDICDEFSEQH